MKEHDMRMILAAVKHYMDMDLRSRIARELPEAYNAWMGGVYARSVHNDGRPW
jgi:hypothetical protein